MFPPTSDFEKAMNLVVVAIKKRMPRAEICNRFRRAMSLAIFDSERKKLKEAFSEAMKAQGSPIAT
jgi:predicted chitinase